MRKDWTGAKTSVFTTIGAIGHTEEERERNDFYATDPAAIDLLLKKVELPLRILEPACGSGCLSTRLAELGHEVKSYDLIDRGYGEVRDFFTMDEPPFEGDYAIVTNPPYKYAKEFVLHSLSLVPDGSYVCMFLKTTFAEGKTRYNELFRNYPPTTSYSALSASYAPKTAILRRVGERALPLRTRGGSSRRTTKVKPY